MLANRNVTTQRNRKVAGAPSTGYMTLLSFSSINSDQFKVSDRAATSKHWYKVFLQNSVSEEIFDAIASKSNTEKEKAQRESASTMYEIILSTLCNVN